MTPDEQPPHIDNSGVTDPAVGPDGSATGGETSLGTFTGTASTPFGITSATAATSAIGVTALANSGTIDLAPQHDAGVAPGGFVDLDLASRDAAIQALKDTDAPIALADELVAAVAGQALKAIVAARLALITAKGHTADADDFLPIGWLPMEARHCLDRVRALIGTDPLTRDLGAARAAIADAIAFCMAAIDRLDRGMQQGER